MQKNFNSKKVNMRMFLISLFLFLPNFLSAETVTGNGYIVNQTLNPLNANISGNGYTSQDAVQLLSETITGNGYKVQSVLTPSVTPTSPAPIQSITGSGWGYYVLPASTTLATSTSKDTIFTSNGSTCKERIALASPIDIGLKNDPAEVKKLQVFLNTYEGEKLAIDGIYGKEDVIAVKKWQEKYRANILSPMKLKKPTGTIYTSSMRQIERQTTQTCGQQIIVHACPFFKVGASYGDVGTEVRKVQQFLNITRGEKLPINGKYGPSTRDAVRRFQKYYRKDIVSIIKLSFITGNWNKATQIKANEVIGCDVLK